ncbi:MAG TPA: hypothetical protein VFO79_00330 [Xanthomonadales bacterium]|nr:hypothetical protein [Xanthomonadales bacterium]
MRTPRCVVVLLLASGPAVAASQQSNVPESQRPRAQVDAPRADCRWSSGAFNLPEGAQSVDGVVLNRSAERQKVRVSVYAWGGSATKLVAPGAVTADVEPNASFHNANSVGLQKPFRTGLYYEVFVEAATPLVLPTVSVWSNHGNTGIAGTRIGPSDFVQLDCRKPH